LVGTALVVGRWMLLVDGLKRLVIAVKQATVHRRTPLV